MIELNGATLADAKAVYHRKYDAVANLGWGPKLRFQFNYFTPDEYYEAQVAKLVSAATKWLDVGCGRHIFLSNAGLAQDFRSYAVEH